MGFWEHDSEFMGRSIVEYTGDDPIADVEQSVPRIGVEYDDPEGLAIDRFQLLLQDPAVDQVKGLVVGAWEGEMFESPPNQMLEVLIEAAPRLSSLEGLFWGDIISEECEVSWIQQTDVSPIWAAFPHLKQLRVRGAEGLSLGEVRHDFLETLILESGGFSKQQLSQVLQAHLPQLSHLEIYLGSPHYGGDTSIDDLKPLLDENLFPKLSHVGLRSSEFTDEIAVAVCQSPLIQRISSLDLSLGTLGNVGGEALLNCPAITQLKAVNLDHHYMSDDVAKRLTALGAHIRVTDPQGDVDQDERYCAVSE